MGFEEYKERVLECVGKYLPEAERYKDIKSVTVNKNNGKILTGVGFCEEGACSIAYLEDGYKMFNEGLSIEQTAEELAKCICLKNWDIETNVDKNVTELIKDNVFYVLVNTEKNKELLKEVPHREVLDLSIIYRIFVYEDDDVVGSFVIHNRVAERSNMSEDDLYKMAMKNVKEKNVPVIRSMEKTLKNMLPKENENDDFDADSQMVIISNKYGTYGALYLLSKETLRKIATVIGADKLYILPSSIHEVIVLNAEAKEPYELQRIVNKVNSNCLSVEEFLSGNVYEFEKKSGKLDIATK